MERKICCTCVTLILLASYDAAAQSKKKGKEPELAISKRGKLIFEDDFSGKELLWNFDSSKGEWEIAKGVAVMKTGSPWLSRAFLPQRHAILQIRMLAPPDCNVNLLGYWEGGYPLARITFQKAVGTFYLCTYSEKQYTPLAQSPLSYKKPRWVNMTFEILGSEYAFTVDGRTIRCEWIGGDDRKIDTFRIGATNSPFAIDDVKVWEALPKDKEDDKDKKKK